MFGSKQQTLDKQPPAQLDFPYIPAVAPAVEAPVQVPLEQPLLAVRPKMNNDIGTVYQDRNPDDNVP